MKDAEVSRTPGSPWMTEDISIKPIYRTKNYAVMIPSSNYHQLPRFYVSCTQWHSLAVPLNFQTVDKVLPPRVVHKLRSALV